jgi:hypothetical protein
MTDAKKLRKIVRQQYKNDASKMVEVLWQSVERMGFWKSLVLLFGHALSESEMSYLDDHEYDFWDVDGDDVALVLRYDRIKRETKNAWLVEFGEGLEAEEVWFPKSQCSLMGGKEIEVPEWLVLENELEDFTV